MKLKKYLIICLVALAAMQNNGCSDVLNVAPDGNMTMEDILSDPTHVEGLLNACYRKILEKGVQYWFWDQIVIASSDDAWCAEDGMGQAIDMYYADSGSASWHPYNDWPDWHNDDYHTNYRYWEFYWPQIRLCTQFINIIDEAAVRRESDRGRFKAEAHVLRAYFYMELVKWYGRVPIMREEWPFDNDFSELQRDPVYDIAKFIGEDCDIAINTPDNEFPWRIEVEAEVMRVTKALAHSLKAKAMLFAASPLHNNGENHWDEAYEVCQQAVTSLKAHGYELYSTCTNPDIYGNYPAAAYHQLFCENPDFSAAPRDRETIWAHKSGGTFGWHIAYIGKPMSNAYKAGTSPTQELIDAYETIDGEPVLDLAKPYLDEERHLQPNYNPNNKMYDPNNPYKNRDPRMTATTMQNGSVFKWSNGVDYVVEAYFGADGVPDGMHYPTIVKSDRTRSRTGYFMRKMVQPGACDTNQVPSANWKFHRLGELLMDYAEAAMEANHLVEAKAAVDEVRARVSMPPLPAGLTQDQMRLRIHNERRIELAWEENRYYDMRRWQKPNGDLSKLSKYLTGMWITKHPNGSFTYERINIQDNPRGGWQNKDLFLPIPLADISRIGNPSWQNPGW